MNDHLTASPLPIGQVNDHRHGALPKGPDFTVNDHLRSAHTGDPAPLRGPDDTVNDHLWSALGGEKDPLQGHTVVVNDHPTRMGVADTGHRTSPNAGPQPTKENTDTRVRLPSPSRQTLLPTQRAPIDRPQTRLTPSARTKFPTTASSRCKATWQGEGRYPRPPTCTLTPRWWRALQNPEWDDPPEIRTRRRLSGR